MPPDAPPPVIAADTLAAGGYLKTGAEIMVLRGTVDCAHVLDLMTEYVTTTANTKMMHTWDVVTVPAADGNQLTCFGEIENSSISCHGGNGHTILVRGRHEG